MSQNTIAMNAIKNLYEESGVKGLREFQKTLKDYMSKVVGLEKLGDEMSAEIIPDQKVLDKLAKQTKKHTKDLHKSLRSHFTAKRKQEREAAKALEPERPRGRPVDKEKAATKLAAKQAKEAAKVLAAKNKLMGEAFRYFKRIQRDANRIKAADAKVLERISK